MARIDIGEMFDSTGPAERGSFFPLLNPRTRAPLTREDNGNPIGITLLGRHSKAFRNSVRAQQEARAMLPAQSLLPADFQDQENMVTLIACTRDWVLDLVDGEELACSPANVEKFWRDERFRALREQGIAFILNDGNFLAQPSSHSNAGQGASSSSSDRSQKVARFDKSSASTA